MKTHLRLTHARFILATIFGLAVGCGDTATDTGAGGSTMASTTVSTGTGNSGAGGGSTNTPCTAATLVDACGASTECATRACEAGTCSATYAPKGTVCGEASAKTQCDGEGACLEKHCFDLTLNGGESDIDCGGPCAPCLNGRVCNDSTDCASRLCNGTNGAGENAAKTCIACTGNGACAVGTWCNAGTCVKLLGNGAACDDPAQCPGSYCVDGVCCNSACAGKCDTCVQSLGAEKDGACSIRGIRNADDDGRCDATHGNCGGACTCDGQGVCVRALGASCEEGADCASGHCTDGVCCNAACNDGCAACSVARGAKADGECNPFAVKGAENPGRCDASHGGCDGACTCNELGACHRAEGEACTLDAECSSGHCADGVCCNTECTGSCNTCVKSLGAEKDGTCKKVVHARLQGSCDATHGGCDGGACTCNAESACTLENPAVSVVAGTDHTCAILTDGAVKCWGQNAAGQLGIGSTTRQTAPGTAVNLGQKATQIAAGNNHTCALLENGSVTCWGDNQVGQLGIGSTTNQTAPGTAVNLGQKATQIAAGGLHTCALLENGTVSCWGWNSNGQLGLASFDTLVSTPQPVSLGFGIVTQLAAGTRHTCAIHLGAAKCWGSNLEGQLGRGTVGGGSVGPANEASSIALGGPLKALSAGGNQTCALLSNGLVRCWGANGSGQLGIGNQGNQGAPTTVALNGEAVALATNGGFTCVVLADGAVKCWGSNQSGQLGRETTVNQGFPTVSTNVGADLTATEVALGLDHTCAVLKLNTGNAIKCWGSNTRGQLGLGDTTSRGATSGSMGDNLPFVLLTP